MKKLLLAIVFVFFVSGIKAQVVWHFYVDYSAASFDDSLTLWQLRTFDNPNDTTDVNYAAVTIIGPLAGYSDPSDIYNTINEYSYFNGSLTFDSLFAYVNHKNHSGLTDTIVFQFVTLDNNGKPTNTVLYSNTIYTNQSLSDSNEVVKVKCAPNFTTTQGQAVGITIKYFGAIEDTFKLQAGYYKDELGEVELDALAYQNSYTLIKPHYNSIVKNHSITNYGGTPIKAQNWRLATVIRIYGGSVNENKLAANIYPNPAQNTLTINFAQVPTENINVQVLNTLGQVVKTQVFDKSSSEKLNMDIGELPTGIYFLQLQNQKASKAFKLVKQ